MLAMSKERGAETSKENTREIRQSTTDNTHTHIYIHRRRNYHQWPFDRENKWYHHLKHEPINDRNPKTENLVLLTIVQTTHTYISQSPQ